MCSGTRRSILDQILVEIILIGQNNMNLNFYFLTIRDIIKNEVIDSMKPIHVLIVDNDPLVFFSVGRIVRLFENYLVIGKVDTLEEALERLRVVPVDLIVIDPEKSAQTQQKLSEIKTGTDFLLIGQNPDASGVNHALKMGVWDYIIKPFTHERLRLSFDLYKTYHAKRSTLGEHPTQEDLDALFLPRESGALVSANLSTGNGEMFERILGIIQKTQLPLSAGEIAKELQVSRITVRKYCEALVISGKLCIRNQYQTKGRPIKKYRVAA